MVTLLSVVSTTLQNRLKLAQTAKQNLTDQADVYAKVSELTYLLVTQRNTVAGISRGINKDGIVRDDEGHWLLSIVGDEIRVDGKRYIEESGLEYSLQNHQGLIPINSSGQFWLKRWLETYGLSHVEQSRYADILTDYADADSWRSPSGAEQSEYAALGLVYPANFLLQNCNELYKLIHWRELIMQYPNMLLQCNLIRGDTINLNAIPITLWEQLWPRSAAKVAELRAQNQWLQNEAAVVAVEPSILSLGDDYYATLGGNQFSLSVSKNKISVEVHVELGLGLNPPYIYKMWRR
jgi:general secretion pathway protein K